MGGDEFELFLSEGERAEWVGKLEAFCRRRHEASSGGQAIQFSISSGYVMLPSAASSLHVLHMKADAALYQTKTSGKHGITAYVEGMLGGTRSQLGFNLADLSRNMPGGLLIYKAGEGEEILFASEHLCQMAGCASMQELLDFYGK